MSKRKTFLDILARVAPANARTLEDKARQASWLAKAYPHRAGRFYRIKHVAISQLFRIEGFEPSVREVELTQWGDLVLSIKYAGTGWLQHILPSCLDDEAYGMLPSWAVTGAAR